MWRASLKPVDRAPGAVRPTSRRSGRCRTRRPPRRARATARSRRAARAGHRRARPRRSSGKRNSRNGSSHAMSKSMSWRRRSSTTSWMSARTNHGSRKRSWRSVPHRTSAAGVRARPRSGRRATGPAAPGRAPSAGAAASRSRAARARPSRPRSESGLNSLSMQNSARWVLPVRSTSRWRSSRSTIHGRQRRRPGAPARRRRSRVRRAVSARPSSTRGAWLVGPMNWPENRYDSDGWCCQKVIMLRSRSGRRSSGLSAGVAPPSVTWLPPPVPVWRAVERELLGAEPGQPGLVVERLDDVAQLGPRARSAGR